MLHPNSARDYQAIVHRQLLDEVANGRAYTHACGMIAIELGKRLLRQSGTLPDLVVIQSDDDNKLLPLIYGGYDEFGRHMAVVHHDLVYDVLTPRPLSVARYPAKAFLNPSVIIRYCGTDFTKTHLNREEPTLYEDGLLKTDDVSVKVLRD